MFDRFQVCLGYYWYQAFGYACYEDACHIYQRLENIKFKPAPSDEYSRAMKNPENEIAKQVFDNLVENGYEYEQRRAS